MNPPPPPPPPHQHHPHHHTKSILLSRGGLLNPSNNNNNNTPHHHHTKSMNHNTKPLKTHVSGRGGTTATTTTTGSKNNLSHNSSTPPHHHSTSSNIFSSSSSTTTTTFIPPSLLQYHPQEWTIQYMGCIEFVLSILNIYQVNYKLQLQDVLNLLRIPYGSTNNMNTTNRSNQSHHDDELFLSLYLTIYNIISLFKFNRVMKNNSFHIPHIIKYINYELLKMNYPRALKLISIQNDDQLLLLELFNAMNWLILSYNPILIKHVMSRDYLNQNFMNGELPSDHSLYYFLKTMNGLSNNSQTNSTNNSNNNNSGTRSTTTTNNTHLAYSQFNCPYHESGIMGTDPSHHQHASLMNSSSSSSTTTTTSLIHQFIITINKIFMVMSNIYNKSIQSNLLNMECDRIGYTPFELNLLLLNDHSSQLYQLNTFIGSFNHLLQYYEMIIEFNERMNSIISSHMEEGVKMFIQNNYTTTITTNNSNNNSSNTTTSNSDSKDECNENHPFKLLNSLKIHHENCSSSTSSNESLCDLFTRALDQLPIISKDKYHALRNISNSSSSSSSGSSSSSSSGSSGSGTTTSNISSSHTSHPVFYQIRKQEDHPKSPHIIRSSFLSKQSRQQSSDATNHHHSLLSLYMEMLQHIHDDLLKDIYSTTTTTTSTTSTEPTTTITDQRHV
ncbi:hypothetical protein FDP41_008166 [Naegleria fowleri]|uniref:Uncharacterized protein n=1 Tax=Naegleria fowleri TaxID=5763 RepID=A0A6A5BFA2_NAEFO|nr:uncharacterized protein FDP41_008166 [Naegleria fowleri]KAF0973462.1 hypothetical protein FDP41_008166 [Naegleria fowleri]